ncbi:MAG TPA: type II toxin-antitoxin system prevent-host-death family antitoxin [Solirubrobacterales bacterium]
MIPALVMSPDATAQNRWPWIDWSAVFRNGYYFGHMAKQVTATDAKATILRLLDDAAAGEEIEITRHGRPVARLVPASGARSLKGSFEGIAMTAVDEEQLYSTGERWDAS